MSSYVGYVPFAQVGAELLFLVISERAERATLIITTNLPFSEWTQVFTSARLCEALLDRITDQAHIIWRPEQRATGSGEQSKGEQSAIKGRKLLDNEYRAKLGLAKTS